MLTVEVPKRKLATPKKIPVRDAHAQTTRPARRARLRKHRSDDRGDGDERGERTDARPPRECAELEIHRGELRERKGCGEAERFSLRLSLPREVAAGKVDANLKRGVLWGRVPKARATNGKRIEVAED